MPKYRKPVLSVTEEPKFFVKHYFHQGLAGAKTHKDTIMTAVLVLAIILLGGVLWSRYADSRTDTAWAMVGGGDSITDLESAAVKYGATPAGPWIKIRLADRYMLNGKADTSKAIDLYKEVAASEKADIGHRALYSLASAEESIGKFDDAKKVLSDMSARGGFWGGKATESLKGLDGRQAAYARLEAAEARAQAEAAAKAALSVNSSAPAVESTTPTREAAQATEIPGAVQLSTDVQAESTATTR